MKRYGIAVSIETRDGTIVLPDVLGEAFAHRDDDADVIGKSAVAPGVFAVEGKPTERQYGVIDCAMKVLPGALRAVLAEMEMVGAIGAAVVTTYEEDDTQRVADVPREKEDPQ